MTPRELFEMTLWHLAKTKPAGFRLADLPDHVSRIEQADRAVCLALHAVAAGDITADGFKAVAARWYMAHRRTHVAWHKRTLGGLLSNAA